ncbi:hypothetical protein GCM10011533_07690 [Streptosporangium jomthongense]|nr:hypothetical protein GCM10011533_07690 [Streptosporangium jomthongense]
MPVHDMPVQFKLFKLALQNGKGPGIESAGPLGIRSGYAVPVQFKLKCNSNHLIKKPGSLQEHSCLSSP